MKKLNTTKLSFENKVSEFPEKNFMLLCENKYITVTL